MKQFWIFLFTAAALSAGMPVGAQSPSAAHNYIMVNEVKVSGKTTAGQLSGLPVDQVNRTVSYYDGLGRMLQQTGWQASPTGQDLITPYLYDALGRQVLAFEPYTVNGNGAAFRNDALLPGSGQQTYYQSPPAGITATAYAYSRNVPEKSPLNRPLDQGAPGNTWQPYRASISGSGHSVRTGYATNTSSEVRQWILYSNGNGATSGYYEPNRLKKSITCDENWQAADGLAGTTETFTNLDGLVVLKRYRPNTSDYYDTYYVYDDMGLLRYVLPPAVTGIGSAALTSFTEQTPAFLQYMYGYHYDGRKRLVEKKLPGKGWEYLVYNLLDQVIFTQDANQRAIYQWTFYKYDALGREIMQGGYQDGSDRVTFQYNVVAIGLPLWESRDNSTPTGYTNVAYPNVSITAYWKMQYYDDYLFLNMGATLPPHSTVSSKTRGLLTGKRVYRTDQLSEDWYLYYYDDEGRHKETVGINHRNGIERTTNTYNFAGELTASVREHTPVSAATTFIRDSLQYDHAGRALAALQQINSQARIWLARFSYNEIGQLKQQELHSENGTAFLQTSKYAYNPRGWLKSHTSPQFSFKLGYDTLSYPQYNGNIAVQLWGSGSSFPKRFDYRYDRLNRLTHAASTGVNMNEVVTYTEMGNINTLSRDGGAARQYVYSGNQLQHVEWVTNSYFYDLNGNATTDGHNGASISYNFLNLPVSVSKGLNVYHYVYDAEGKKLQKEDVSTSTVIDYFEGIHTKNDTIDFIQHAYGRARNNSGTYVYEYDLKDHLGNVRYSFDKNGGVLRKLQADDYYAFGLRKVVTAGNNKYLYNSKELQDELGQYDYGARFYDPVVGRWNVIDPLAEQSRRFSPYSYGLNNPVRFIDVDGMFGMEVIGGARWESMMSDRSAWEDLMTNNGDDDPPGWLQKAMDFFKIGTSQPRSREELIEKAEGQERLSRVVAYSKQVEKNLEVLDYIPVLGAAKMMSKGIVERDNTAVAMGAGAAMLDVFGGKLVAKVAEKAMGPALRKIVAQGIDEAAKTSTKLLNQFNSAESLIQGAGNLTKVNAGLQGFVKGDGPSIFKAITQGSVGATSRGGIIMKDGTTLFNHFSTKTGVYTIDINKAGQMYKIRITP